MAGFWYDETAGVWLAEMESTAYAFGLADDGAALRHLHWGGPLPREALAGLLTTATGPMPRHEAQLSLVRERPDEYVPWGGLRFDEPSLKVEFADGTRNVEWRVRGHRITRQGPASTLEVDLADTGYPLLVTLAYRVYDGFDVLDRWATLRARPKLQHSADKHGRRKRGASTDSSPVLIRQAHSANWWLPLARQLAAALPARRLERRDAARADHAHPGQGGTRKPPRHHQPSAPPLVHPGPGRRGHRRIGRAVERRPGLERLMEARLRDQPRRPHPRLRRIERVRLDVPPGPRRCPGPAAVRWPVHNGWFRCREPPVARLAAGLRAGSR